MLHFFTLTSNPQSWCIKETVSEFCSYFNAPQSKRSWINYLVKKYTLKSIKDLDCLCKCPRKHPCAKMVGQGSKQSQFHPKINRSECKYLLKAEVNKNRSEVWSNKGIVKIKMGWEHYQTVDPPPPPEKRALGLQGTVWCTSTNSLLQISIFQNPLNLPH